MLRVLMFHRIADPRASSTLNPALISATPAVFDRIVACLARSYQPVSMPEVIAAMAGERALPERAVLLTFDDGYTDFGETAWPTLKRHGVPATLFVPTSYVGAAAREFWWDRLFRAFSNAPMNRLERSPIGPVRFDTPDRLFRSLRRMQRHMKSVPHDDAMTAVDRLCEALECPDAPARATLTWADLRRLAGEGVTLAPHTRTHPLLTRIPAARVREEVAASRDDLTRETGASLPVFAYPSGAHDATVRTILREEGFQLAFTTSGGHNPLPCANPLQLRRTNITPRTSRVLLPMRLTKWAGTVDRWRHADGFPSGTWRDTAPSAGPGTVAYVMSRFPKLTETFVLNEILAVEQQGLKTEVFPLLRERQAVVHEEARAVVARTRFQPLMSAAVAAANLRTFVRQPGAYGAVWSEVLREAWGSVNFLVGAIGILPKCVWMAREMERAGVRHVHAHFANHPAVAALVIHRLTGIPFSFTAHGSDLHVDRRMLPAKVEAASFVVAISEFNRSLILDSCGARHADKVHVVHCGVDPDWFGRRPPPSANGRFEIVCVASFERIKGHRHLVRACEILQRRGIDFVCHLVGDGPLRREVESQIAAAGLGSRIVLHGARTRREVAELMRSADAAVLASAPTRDGRREGIPVALMEAMSAGLPVVATKTGGIPELVESDRNGFLVAPGDPGALASALERLAREPELRARLGAAARKTILRGFSQQACAATLMDLFGRSAGPVTVAATPVGSSWLANAASGGRPG